MKRNIIHKLTASMMIAAGILIGAPEDLFAQSQSQSKSSSQQTQSHSNHGANHNAAKGGNKSMSQHAGDANFVKKASESNLAEIKLSELALQKSSSAKVKEYAQMMIQHHTAAQTELASIVSTYTSSTSNRPGMSDSDANDADKMSTMGGTGGTKGNAQADGMTNGQYNSNISKKDKVGADNSTNPSGATTATGSTYSSGNANGAVGTTGNQEGRSPDGTASQNTPSSNDNSANTNSQADANSTTNPSMSGTRAGSGQATNPNNTTPAQSNDANNAENDSEGTGGGGAGANSGGTTSSMSNGRISRTSPDTQSDNEAMTNSAGTNNAMNTGSSGMRYDLPNELSAEHKALRNKLAGLSGAEFDKQYMQAMVKDHAKSVELFEKHALVSNEGDSQLRDYASKNLPLIKEHYEKAKALSGNSTMNNNSSKKGSN